MLCLSLAGVGDAKLLVQQHLPGRQGWLGSLFNWWGLLVGCRRKVASPEVCFQAILCLSALHSRLREGIRDASNRLVVNCCLLVMRTDEEGKIRAASSVFAIHYTSLSPSKHFIGLISWKGKC